MKKVALLSLLAILPALAQTPQPERRGLRLPTSMSVQPLAGFAQNFGGVLREGRYVNRDATQYAQSHHVVHTASPRMALPVLAGSAAISST